MSVQAKAQSIDITAQRGGHNGSYLLREPYITSHSPYLVHLNHSSVRFINTALQVSGIKSLGISQDHTIYSFIYQKGDSLRLFSVESPGKRLINISSSGYEKNDPSLKIYSLNDGRTIVRSNIAHFDLYNQDGTLNNAVSNAAGTAKGETISMLAISPDGTLILAYNPKIFNNNSVQSRIQKINFRSGTISLFYYNNTMSISDLRISHDGQFILATFKHGHRSKVVLFDRFGNILRKFSFHYNPDAVVLAHDDKYIAVTYKNHVEVYDILNGRSVGGTYLRSYLFYGTYIPEDHMVLCLAGDYHPGSEIINDVKVYGVDLKARKIGKGTYSASLKWDKGAFSLSISRLRMHHYEIKGFSNPLFLSAVNY